MHAESGGEKDVAKNSLPHTSLQLRGPLFRTAHVHHDVLIDTSVLFELPSRSADSVEWTYPVVSHRAWPSRSVIDTSVLFELPIS